MYITTLEYNSYLYSKITTYIKRYSSLDTIATSESNLQFRLGICDGFNYNYLLKNKFNLRTYLFK